MSRPERDVKERLFEKRIIDKNGCWIWTGGRVHGVGYGTLHWRGGPKLTHRVSYIIFKGEIPEKYVVDHLCRNELCFNPDHLEAVTNKENNLRGTSPAAINAKKTHCKNGHELNNENMYLSKDGKRLCRPCRKEASKRHRNSCIFVNGKYIKKELINDKN